jgi:hypothetical protein
MLRWLKRKKSQQRLEQEHISEIHKAYQEGYSAAKLKQLEEEEEEKKWKAFAQEKKLQKLKEEASPFGKHIVYGKYEE